MEATIKDGHLNVRIPVDQDKKGNVTLRQSSSGKMLLLATSGGFSGTTLEVQGQPLRINLTAGITNKEYEASPVEA